MKITIAYLPAEAPEAAAVVAVLRDQLPSVRIHENGIKGGYKHTFLTTKNPGKPRNSKENA